MVWFGSVGLSLLVYNARSSHLPEMGLLIWGGSIRGVGGGRDSYVFYLGSRGEMEMDVLISLAYMRMYPRTVLLLVTCREQ